MPIINFEKDTCTRCHACVRACPTQAIIVDSKTEYPVLNHNRCIGCGGCVTVCGFDAMTYMDSRNETKKLIRSGQKVAAVVMLSISGEFTDISDYRKFVEMIRRLGFTYVVEASLGVDLVAQRYAELFEKSKGKNYITANCPSISYYIEKFHPELVENLAPIVSPMAASAKVVRKKYGDDVKVVFIGPCVAAKMEAERYIDTDGQVDSVLTFKELRQLFAEFNIKEGMFEYSNYDEPHGNLGSLYPISNGILSAANISDDIIDGHVITTEGRDNIIRAINEFELRPENIKRHFNLFYDEGCLMGPGTSKGGKRFLRQTLITSYTRKRLREFNRRDWAKNMKLYSSSLDLNATFKANDQRLPVPSDRKINEILKSLGLSTSPDAPACGGCGFSSCRELAISVANGVSHTETCIAYSLNLKKQNITKLEEANKEIGVLKDALEESEKKATFEQEIANDARQTIETILQKLPVSLIVVDENLKVVHTNHRLIEMLGTEAQEINDVIPGLVGANLKSIFPFQVHNLFTYVHQNNENITNRDIHFADDNLLNISIFTIVKDKLTGAIIRDMQAPDVRKEEVVKRVYEVVDKNLEMVQKIGFLLGEGAAETEQMLNSIVELYKNAK